MLPRVAHHVLLLNGLLGQCKNELPANFDLKAVQQTLSRCASPELWSLV